MKKNRIGFCSFGKIAQTHMNALVAMKHDLPGGTVETNSILTRKEKPEHQEHFNRIFTDLEQFMSDEEIDIVDVCSANYQHFPQAMAAMRHGKSVYCEKPTGMNLQESKELYEYAEANGIVNGVALSRRWNPTIIAGRDIFRSGLLGKIINFKGQFYHWSYNSEEKELTWRQQFELGGAGAISDLGIHTIDSMRFILGEIDEVVSASRIIYEERFLDETKSEKGKVSNDEYTAALLKLADGTIGILESARVCQNIDEEEPYLSIYGTKGVVVMYRDHIDWFDITEQRYRSFDEIEPSDFHRYVTTDLKPKENMNAGGGHYSALKNMILMHQGGKKYPETPDLKEAYLDFQVIDAIMRSWESKKWEKVSQQ